MPSNFLRRSAFTSLAAGLTLLCTKSALANQPQTTAWVVIRPASSIRFSSALSGAAIEGSFARWTANIVFDPKNLAASSAVVSIETGSALLTDKDQTVAIRTQDWFWSSKFPTATFTSRSFRHTIGNNYVAEGILSLRGVERPMSFPFTLALNGANAVMHASFGLDRRIFGVGQGDFRDELQIPGRVTVTLDVRAHAQTSAKSR